MNHVFFPIKVAIFVALFFPRIFRDPFSTFWVDHLEFTQKSGRTVETNGFSHGKIGAFHIDLGALFLVWRDMDRSQNMANSNPQDCGHVTDLL